MAVNEGGIPIFDIEGISLDNTYAGEEKNAIRIGTPFATTDRVVIKTKKETISYSQPIQMP